MPEEPTLTDVATTLRLRYATVKSHLRRKFHR